MGSRRERGRRSRFWVVVFALMLLACSAGPVLAAEPVAERAPESTNFTPPPEEETLASRVPNAQDVSKALGEYERREHEREEWLKTPEAVRQREDSRLAFVNSSPSDSEGLLRTAFPRELEVLNSDPGRFLSDAQLVASLGASGAVVRGEGETSLLETTVPLRTEDEEGRLAKVDLSLKAIPGGFETDNAIAGLRLPDSADKGVEVGEAGVEIRQAGAADSDARRYGDKNLFYHEALPDTDLLASATSFGVELYDLLRSEDSPQDLRFRIAVPDGAELRSDGRGGAEVLREGERLTLIPRPSAKDAQGTDVPIQTEVREGSLVVHVPHRTGDYTYPILVDPIAEDWVNQGKNWYGGDNWGALSNGAWKWDPESNGDYHHDICCWEGSHAGLLTIAEPVFFGPEQFGQWSYSTQNEHVYIPHIWLIPFNRADNGCGSQQPHDYAGLWNPESELWSPIWIDYAKTYGNLAGDGVGRALVIGEGSGPPGVWLACQRVLYVGGAGVWLTDDYPPIIFGVDGLPPDEWISNEDHLHIEVATGDEGLGVHAVNVNLDGGESIEDKVGGCTGLYGNRCPNNYTTAFNATGASFRQGIRTNSVSAEDPIGRGVSSQFQSKVDYSPPEVELKGQLARETNTEVELGEEQPAQDQGEEGEDELSLPVYHLNIRATDGSNASNETRQSGMRDIKLRLDSEELEVPWEEQECSQDSCEMEENYPLQLTGLKAKKHKLVVEAIDWVGKKRLREIEFEYIPATGMKDEYVMQYFPLPDGQGNEEGEEHPVRPELAVNVMNGNLVYRQRDVDVEGPAADLEVERFYNSQLPESENTEWGDGWTLAQTPKLEPEFEEPAPTSADMVQDSGAITNAVGLPPESGEEMFDPELQATITKEADGSYTVADESGETEDTLAFNSGGKVTELRTPGDAEVDYGYEGGDLAEIAVEDPGSAGAPTEPPEGEGEYEEGPAPEARPAPTYASSLGSPGSEEGQLDSPGGVAIHSSGDVWVADKGNDRIERFGPDGQFLSAFGSSGSGNGQLDEPFDLAIGGQGNLWVADHGNDRVQQFSPQGEYLGQFGSPGSEEGQLEGPEGIAIGAGGAIWVSDYSRVQKFNAQGEALALLASQGSEPGQIGNPAGLDAAEGDVWVSDWSNHRIEAFTEAGEFVRQFGSQGSGEGELEYPQDVEIDADGHAWVADQGNNRVQEFDQGGEYLAQFGAQGSGEGEFDLDFPMGIASDADGAIFVSDPGNDRVQKWGPPGEHLTPYTGAIFADNLGSSGSEEGQLDSPGGVAIDSSGDVWVADKGNDRIERFGPDGQFLSAFGSSGSGNGQLSSPTGLAINAQGDLWVIDAGNHRVQEFSPEGKYLTKFGSSGTGNGQFQIPRGIAIAPNGNIWVGDAEESRIQEFGPQGGYLGQIGLSGFSVRALDIDSGGRLWVGTDPGCALKLDTEGEVLASNCEVGEPAGLTADANGNIWVADQGSGKILLLGRDAEQVLQFGSEGTGEGEFEIVQPSGMAVGDANDIWIADPGNDRVQKWVAGSYVPNEEELEPDDPSVEVDVSGGLVDAVQGEKAGAHSYSHEGNDLTAYSGPEGETAYEYDTEGRMTKVTLPNGTWGEIAYFEDGRVKSVTVDPAGEEAAKTTHFEYVDNPSRSTTVVLPGTPNVTYDIGEDGSVFKWQNVQKPPTIDYIVGTLGDVENRETAEPLSSGEHRLTVQAHGDEGIVSIQVIVNNTTLVSEQTCPPEECQTLQDEWVMETANFAPGRLYIEVLVTDSEGESTSERYWVNIPQPPPPPAPGTPVPPKFRDIAKFREEYGLEVVFPVKNEIELNERIFNLIKAWHEPDTPEGEVARATMDRWGVPLRPADVAELDYRERFLAHDGPIIAQAGESNYPESYAGYYMDHRAGGKLRVGFTQDMASRVAGVAELSTLTAGDRLTPFANEPDWSLSSLYGAASEFRESVTSHQEITALLTTTGVDVKGNQLTVGATEVAPVASFIDEHFGSTTPLDAVFDPNKPEIQSDELHPRERYRNGRAFAGDHITLACTLGFGAWEEATNPGTGAPVLREFALTAGHCGEVDWENEEVGEVGEEVELWSLEPGGYHVRDPYLGHVARNAHLVNQAGAFTDLAAIRINAPSLVPRWVYWSSGSQSMINGESEYVPGGTLCRSGVSTGLRCGPAEAEPTEAWYKKDEAPYELPVWLIKVDMVAQRGDSGAPVVDPMSGSAVGIHSGGGATKPGANEYSPYSLVQPLLPLEGTDHPQISAGEAPGLGAAALSPRMHIVECCR